MHNILKDDLGSVKYFFTIVFGNFCISFVASYLMPNSELLFLHYSAAWIGNTALNLIMANKVIWEHELQRQRAREKESKGTCVNDHNKRK